MLSNGPSFETLKWLLTTLAIPLTLAVISYQYQSAQTERQATDARLRLYTELLSKREEADTGVRKEIFDRVLATYLKPETRDLESKIVALELLAVNFNDSLEVSLVDSDKSNKSEFAAGATVSIVGRDERHTTNDKGRTVRFESPSGTVTLQIKVIGVDLCRLPDVSLTSGDQVVSVLVDKAKNSKCKRLE